MADASEELNLNLTPSPPHSFPLSLSLQLNPSSSEDITIEGPQQNEAELRRRRRYGRRATPNRMGNEDIRFVILTSIDRQLEQASVSPEKASDEVSSPLSTAKDFECNICLDMAGDPVVTACGHLFCWPCLYQWIYLHSDVRECPVCKGEVRDIDIIPIYGRGNVDTEAEAVAEAEGKCSSDHSNLKIPKRPHAHRVESSRIEGFRRSRRRSIPAWLDADDMVEYGGEHGNASLGRGDDGYFRFGRGTMEVRNRLRALRDVLENNRRSTEDSSRQTATEDDRRVRQRIMGGRRRLFESQSRANRAPHIGEGEDDVNGRMSLGFESTLAREREEMSRHLAFLRRHVRAERSPSRDTRSRTTPRHSIVDEDERIPLGMRASLSRDQEEMSRHLALLRRHVRSEWSSQLEPRRRTTSPLMLDVEGLESSAATVREHNEMSEHPTSLHPNVEPERVQFLGSITATSQQSVVHEVEEIVPPRLVSSIIREQQDEFSRSLPSAVVNIRAARSLPLAPRTSRTSSHMMVDGVEERIPSGLETSLAREHEAMARHLAFLRHIRADRFPSLESRAVTGPHLDANEAEERTPLGLETSVARVQEELSRRLAFLQRIRTDRAPLLESRTSTSPIVVDEVEERMASRLETSLAREQEEILRNLALIRHIRADRLAAIRARLASMEGMLETLVSADHQSEHAGSSGPVQLATNIHQDFLPDVQEEESGEVSV